MIQKTNVVYEFKWRPNKKNFQFFKINDVTQDIFVFHDDLDIEFSSLRIKNSGGTWRAQWY